MGHYSEYYEAEAERQLLIKSITYKNALDDLRAFTQYNAKGKTGTWTFSDIGLEADFNILMDKLKAKLYDLGVSSSG